MTEYRSFQEILNEFWEGRNPGEWQIEVRIISMTYTDYADHDGDGKANFYDRKDFFIEAIITFNGTVCTNAYSEQYRRNMKDCEEEAIKKAIERLGVGKKTAS